MKKSSWGLGILALAILTLLTVGIFYLAVRADNVAEQKADEEEAKEKAERVAAEAAYIAANAPTMEKIRQELEYPSAGEAFIKKGVEIKIWLDPKKSFTTGTRGSAKYELEGHPSIYFVDHFDGRQQDLREWWKFPAGRYIVTTTAENEIHFQWWQKGR
jgi:hypothetical protein